jgi:hypothetical protein
VKRPMLWWWLLFGVTLVAWLTPVAYRTTRLFLLVCIASLWGLGLFCLRNHKRVAISLVGVGAALLVWVSIPGGALDPQRLREEYVEALKRYDGTRYIWGGENRLGIDCSGLVRNGLIDANVRVGLRTGNPRLIRTALGMWWDDCSAKALRDSYRAFTVPLFRAESINSITNTLLMPGDIAVTANGVHVLAYLGGQMWIQADPSVMKTSVVEVPSETFWFSVPVHVMRWTQLSP